MAELKHRLKALRQVAVSILSRLRGKPAPLLEDRSSSSVELAPPGSIDLPPLSPKATPASRDDVPPTPIQALPSETVPLAPISSAALKAVPLPLPVVIESDAKSPAPVHRDGQVPQRGNPSLVIYGLGRFRAYCDDQLITTWRSKKGKTIFKYILTQRDHQVAKDILMDVFWPDATPEAARNDLNVAIYGLRGTFKSIRPNYAFILYEDEHYVINPEIELWVDFEQFSKHCEAAQGLERNEKLVEALTEYERAESLYQGDFLEEDRYEDWPVRNREYMKDNYLLLLDSLSRHYLSERMYTVSIQFCHKILRKDDCREDAHRRLMLCYCLQGERNLALHQYDVCVENLARALDMPPMEETTALYRKIRNGNAL